MYGAGQHAALMPISYFYSSTATKVVAHQTRKPKPSAMCKLSLTAHMQSVERCARMRCRANRGCETSLEQISSSSVAIHFSTLSPSVGTLQASSPFPCADAANQTSAASPASAQASAAAAAASSSPIASPVRARAGDATAVVRLPGRGAGRRHETGMRLAERREYGVWRRAAASRNEDTEMAATEAPASPSTASRLPQL